MRSQCGFDAGSPRTNTPSVVLVLAASSLGADPLLQLLHRTGPAQVAVSFMRRSSLWRPPCAVSWALLARPVDLRAAARPVRFCGHLRRGDAVLHSCRLRWLQFNTVDLGEGTLALPPVLLEAVPLCISLLSFLFCGGAGNCSSVIAVHLSVAFIILDFGLGELRPVVLHVVALLRPAFLHL